MNEELKGGWKCLGAGGEATTVDVGLGGGQ